MPNCRRSGTLSWNRGGEPSGSIGFEADMRDPEASQLVLDYRRGQGESSEKVRQVVRLVYTLPNYGGRRWWMICPYEGNRVGKLYLPTNGDRFAGRKAWRLGYHIQRVAPRDKTFEALFKLQKELGCEQGWGNLIIRPKGMWQRTFERHWQRFEELEERCGVEIALLADGLAGFAKLDRNR